jgi:predicted  nucleic acid-binding Zn-ribbon protein
MKALPEDQNLLIDLQALDSAIDQANFRLKNLPEHEQIKALHGLLENAAVELTVVETELADVSIELRRAELEVEQVTDRMAKDEARLGSGSASPKELEQLQHEVATLTKRKADLEEGELEIMMKHDSVKKRVDELLNDQVGLKKLEVELNSRLAASTAQISSEREVKQAERAALAPKIDPALVELYEKIRASAHGVGAALLIGNECKGCNLAINTIEMERIKGLAADEVLRCEECRRIMVRA